MAARRVSNEWSNWSGSVVAKPSRIVFPRTEAELCGLVASARQVRVVGAGHSFMPLSETDDLLVSLAELEGDLRISADRRSVSAPAGWSLKRLTQALWEHGLSLTNQGDVNPQTVAGALATGTHGTGAKLGSLSTLARAFRLILSDGSIAMCSQLERPDLFEAARLSLGLVGVATRIDIAVESAFGLEERLESLPYEVARDAFLQWAQSDRHVEFFVFPYGRHAIVKRLTQHADTTPVKKTSDMDESGFKLVCAICAAAPQLTGWLQASLVPKTLKARRVGPAYQIFPSERTVRFEEMEYALPLESAFAALDAVIAWIKERRLPVTFPFEVRIVAGDDVWLSPFNRGAAIAVSMHQYAPMAWREIFAAAEAVFRDHGGRPHWGKRHTLDANTARAMYPKFEAFDAVRRAIDPSGKFVNAHLGEVLGVSGQGRAK